MMSSAPPAKPRVLLSSGNLAVFRKQIQQDYQAKYGASGLALRTNTDQIIPTLPSQTALQADGTFLYEHDDNSQRLSDRGYAEFKADVARYRLRDDLRITDDINLYRHILDNMSANSVLETESNSTFPAFLLQPLGDQAIPFMNLTILSHSLGDALTTFSRAQHWLSIKHDPLSDTLLETFAKINAGGDQFAADFGSDQYPNHVSIDKLKALITLACLPGSFAPFQSAVFFRQAPQTFDYPATLQAKVNNWSSAHSANFNTDSVSEQGQSSAFLSTTQRSCPLTQSNPSSPRPHCPDCYTRTGNKYHNHGVPNTPHAFTLLPPDYHPHNHIWHLHMLLLMVILQTHLQPLHSHLITLSSPQLTLT
jgi:hypothetical protein